MSFHQGALKRLVSSVLLELRPLYARFSRMRNSKTFLFLVLVIVAMAGCDSGGNGAPPEAICEPDMEAWASTVAPIVDRHCGACHGEAPEFGAPSALVDHAALLAGEAGMRQVDLMVNRVADGTMPPVGMPRPPQEEMQALVDWASCGEESAAPPAGLVSSAPIVLAPENPPAGLEEVELLAPEFPVGVDIQDHYQCWTFEAPVTEDKFIRRMQVVIDESRVLHHLVLLRDTEGTAPDGAHECIGMPEGSDYLFAWAPSPTQGAFQFPEGGLRIRPGDRYVMQIHYNNGSRVPDVRDSSGVRLYLGPPAGPEYGMLALGPLGFAIPPRSSASSESACTMTEPMTILSGAPHMHEIGSAFEQRIERADGTVEPFISLTGWSFETQLFYDTPAVLEPGDAMYTRCTWDNPTDATVRSGPYTGDEMCFNFAYVTPPPASRYCDEEVGGVPDDVSYAAGECAPMDVPAETTLAVGTFTAGDIPTLNGGSATPGIYALTGAEQLLESPELPVGNIDSEASSVLGRGWLEIGEDTLALDISLYTHLATDSGFSMGRDSAISYSGPWDATESPARTTPSCPADAGAQTVDFQVDGDTIVLGYRVNFAGVDIYPRFTFTRMAEEG